MSSHTLDTRHDDHDADLAAGRDAGIDLDNDAAQEPHTSHDRQRHSAQVYQSAVAPVAASHNARSSLAEVEGTIFKSALSLPEDETVPPQITPFFTVIDNPETGEFYHPDVHYIFEDDDPSLLISAAIDAVEASGATTVLEDNANHQIAIVDVDRDGKSVTNVSSISRGWQAVRAEITQAPSWGNALEGVGRGMMLRLNGKDLRHTARPDTTTGSIDELITAFDSEMECLDDIMQLHERESALQAEALEQAVI